MRDRLKLSFPQVLEWFDEIDSREVEEFLRRWPTLEKLQRARSATLGRFFERHHPRSRQRNGERVAAIRQAHGAMPDAAVRAAARAMVATLLRLLGTLAEGIAELEKQIEQITAAEEDFALFDSFPGAGRRWRPACSSRLERGERGSIGPRSYRALSGIAPVVQRSGEALSDPLPLGSPRSFCDESFHEFAAFSTRKSVWARAYYEQQRAKGKDHQAAVRALAFKWIRDSVSLLAGPSALR